MTNLSPATQAVLDAANASATNAWSDATHQRFRTGVADALRAAADQVVPEGYDQAYDCCLEIMSEIRVDLLAIADELEQTVS